MAQLNRMAEEILDYVRQTVNEGPPPSVREICQALHIKSTSTVHRYLKLLEQEGYIFSVKGRGNFVSESASLFDEFISLHILPPH